MKLNMVLKFNSTVRYLLNIVFTSVLLELFLGGSGRLIELTPFLTLRMCLFLVYMIIIVLYLVFKPKLHIYVTTIFACFVMSCTLAVIVGIVNGASGADVFNDVKPLLNTFLILYLYYSVNTTEDISYVIKLVKISAVLLTLMHLVLTIIVLYNKDIAIIYSALSEGEEDINKTMFFFKGDSGFVNYTGDIYLCVGFILWEQYHKNEFVKAIILLLISLAIIATGTRGLIFTLGLVYFLKFIVLKFNYKSLFYIAIGALAIAVIFVQIKSSIGDKEESDSVRINTIQQVVDRITPISIIIGHGFGHGVPERPLHMEISYLEVFHKQGLVGLFYYFIVFAICYIAYKNCKSKDALGWYMCILFIYLLTFTNPYINHPLGITVIFVSLISMLKISEAEKLQILSIE